MANGVPVIATNVGAIPEVIASGINGIIVDGYEPGKWLDALNAIKQNDAFAEELRRSARKWVESNFDARRNAAALRSAIDERIAQQFPSRF